MNESTPTVSESSAFARRTLLAGAAGVMATMYLPPVVAAAAPQDYELTDVGPDRVVPVTPTHELALPRVVGVAATGKELSIPAGTVIKLDFDAGMYEPLPEPTASVGGRPIKASVVADDRGTKSVRLDEEVPAGDTVEVVVAVARPRLYPADGYRVGGQPEGVLRTPARRGANRTKKNRTRRELWGVTLDAHWDEVAWGDRYRTFVPTLLLVSSTGPAPASGLRVDAWVDPKIARLRSLTARGGRLKVRSSAVSGGSGRFDLAGSLKEGEQATLELSWALADLPRGELEGLMSPSATIGAARATAAQRSTLRETATRIDSIFNDATWEELRVL